MKRVGCILLLTLMLVGLFVIPAGDPSTGGFSQEEIDSLGETLPNGPYYPDLEFPTNDYLPSADGDVSSESIGEAYGHKFRETSDDDVLFYPDAFYSGETIVASSGTAGPDDTFGLYSYTHAVGGSFYAGGDENTPFEGYVTLNFTATSPAGFKYAVYLRPWDTTSHVVDGEIRLDIYNWDTDTWDHKHTDSNPAAWVWFNGTLYDNEYFDEGQVAIRGRASFGTKVQIEVDYAGLNFYIMTLADSDHYAEGFNDVSDWTSNSFSGDDSFSTDGDVLTFISAYSGGWDYDYVYVDIPDISNPAGLYFEINHRINETAGGLRVLFSDSDSSLSNYQTTYLSEPTSYSTHKFILTYGYTLRSVWLGTETGTAVDKCYQVDYLRIGPATEMGWQHDCSTLEGTRNDADADFTYVDEILNSDTRNCSVITTAATSQWADFIFDYDTTTTASDIERDYYPSIAFRWRCTSYIAGTNALYVSINVDGKRLAPAGGYRNSTFDWVTERYNMKAATTDSATAHIDFIVYTDAVGEGAVFEVEWLRFYSIANWTDCQSASATTNDLWYVSDGVLYGEQDSGVHIGLNYDPVLSVAQATYPVWNITSSLSNLGGSFSFRLANPSWTQFNDEDTRGAVPSGTVNDLALYSWLDTEISAIKFIEDSTAPDILDKFVNPTDPDDDESVTITAVTYDALEVWEVTINAVVYPAGFSDVDYEMTEQTADVLWSYEFSTLLAGYYLFQVTASDCANTYSEYIPVTVRESEITVNSISLFGASDDFDYMHWSFKINKDCSYVIREWSENVGASDTHSGSVAEGVRNIAWEKLPTDDTKVNFTVTFTNASLTYVFDSSYEVAQTALSVTSYDWGFSESQVTLSYQTTKSGTYTLYLDDVQDSTSSFASGSNFLNWSRPSAVDPTEICAAMKLTDGTTTIWLNQTYSEFLLTAFSIQTLFMDLTDPTVSAIFTTSWANATGYLYENDVQKDTQAEGVPLSYTKATVAGAYNVALKMDAGGEVAWYNTTYSVSAEDALSIVALVFDTSGLNVSVYVSTNWANTTVTIYENDVQKTTGSEGALSYVKAIASGDYSVGIKIDGTADSTWANFTYTIDTEASLSITSLNFGIGGSDVTAFATTNWMNATLTLFENDVQKDTGSEGTTLSYTKATAAGDYNIGLKIDAGADLIWANYTYTVSAEDTLSITALSFDTSGLNVSVYVNTNWANTTVTLYENDVQQVTGSEGSLSYLKATSAGDYNVSVKIDGTAATLWANYTYTVAAESALIINTLILDKSGPNVTAFVSTNWGNCTITIYQDDVQKDSDSESVTLSYARSTAAGTYNVAIKIDGGASTLWHNDSYTIALEYSWQYIYVFDTGDPATYFPWESFDFYVNGSLIEKNEFYGRTDQGYRIAVVDKFGDTIYNATHSFDYTYRLSIAIYSFKVKCWVDGEVNVTITSSAGGVMNTWMGWGDLEEFYLFGSKTYQVKWFLDNSDKKVKGTGWHYYPALDWDGNQANADPNWYGPVSASYLTLDDYGIGHLVGVVEDVDDGGGGGDANSTEIARILFQSLGPVGVGVGAAFAGTFLGLYFVYVAIKNIQANMRPPVIAEQPAAEKKPKTKSRTGGSRLSSGVRGKDQRGRYQ